MKKKYIGIMQSLLNDNGEATAEGEVNIFEDFESAQKWFKKCSEGSDYENEFSKENTSVNVSWCDHDGDHMLCIVDDWNDGEQLSKFRNILIEWCSNACETWQYRDWEIGDCFSLCVLKNDNILYNVLEDENFIHDEDGDYEYDLFDDYDSRSAKYLFNIIDGFVKEEPSKETKEETGKDFIDVIADKLLAKAMDKVNAKIENGEDLFDDTIINSIVGKLFEKVSDQLNKRLGL